MDNWSPADFKLLSDRIFNMMAEMLNMIEEGAEWPQALLQGKAVLLPKDPEDRFNPLAYRILLILPNIYRRWAAARLQLLMPWIKKWQLDTMHAGVSGSGAEDAWYITAIHAEHSKVHDKQLHMGGFPRKVLKAYQAYHEQ
eukprot:1473597-Karenia_brevis.AAC.1